MRLIPIARRSVMPCDIPFIWLFEGPRWVIPDRFMLRMLDSLLFISEPMVPIRVLG